MPETYAALSALPGPASADVRAEILVLIPQQPPFRFVDAITHLDESGVAGYCFLDADAVYYQGHFPGYPVTPGVILTEIMAQIGLVPLGIYLLQQGGSDQEPLTALPVLTSTRMQFYQQVSGGQRVYVESRKILFRHGKLRCTVQMKDQYGTLLCEGELAGMMITRKRQN